MIRASHRKRDSREALVRWLRDRSSGGRTSHSGTFACRFPILDCMPFPRFSIESRQSKSPKILAGNILQCFSVAEARPGLNGIRLQLAIYFCSAPRLGSFFLNSKTTAGRSTPCKAHHLLLFSTEPAADQHSLRSHIRLVCHSHDSGE